MEIHNGYQHQWRCDFCRKIRANCLCFAVRAIHLCIKCWFMLKRNFELTDFFSHFRKKTSRLSSQKWFRAMVDRLMYNLENGIVPEPRKETGCDHSNCKHRDTFHVKEFPTPSGHIPKSDAYIFIRAYGGKIICIGK